MTLTRNGITVTVKPDYRTSDPGEWANEDAFLVVFPGKYMKQSREGYQSAEEAHETAKAEGKMLLPVCGYFYDAPYLYLGRNAVCLWEDDTYHGQAGYIVVDPNAVCDPEFAAQSVVETWNIHFAYDVWAVSAKHPTLGDKACVGIYGFDAALDAAHEFYEALLPPPKVFWTC